MFNFHTENIKICKFYNFTFLTDGKLILSSKKSLNIYIKSWGIFEISLVKKENKKNLEKSKFSIKIVKKSDR